MTGLVLNDAMCQRSAADPQPETEAGMNQATDARPDRLAGNGQHRRGDLPLPTIMFDTILTQLQAHGSQTLAELCDPVYEVIRKTKWLAASYPDSPGAYAAFVQDGLDQMASRGIVARDGDAWRLGPKFVTGKRMILIPARKGKNPAVGTTIHSLEEAKIISADDHRRLELSSLYAHLRRGGPGLRPVIKEHVVALAESMRAFGWLKEFPVLIDQHDHILNGRHRLAAAKLAGVTPTEQQVVVADAAEALAIAWAANEDKPWTSPDRKRIAELLTANGPSTAEVGAVIGTKARRVLIEARLREYPHWSDRMIAKHLGCDHKTVTSVRKNLEAGGEIPHRDRILGADGHWDPIKRQPAAGGEIPHLNTLPVPATAAEPVPPPERPLPQEPESPAIDDYKQLAAGGVDVHGARVGADFTGANDAQGTSSQKKTLINKLAVEVDAIVTKASRLLTLDEMLDLVRSRWEFSQRP